MVAGDRNDHFAAAVVDFLDRCAVTSRLVPSRACSDRCRVRHAFCLPCLPWSAVVKDAPGELTMEQCAAHYFLHPRVIVPTAS